jgi:pyridoxal phosphate enzyme (YggS family)
MSIQVKLNGILQDMRFACEKVGRDPHSVQLIAVSKTQSADRVREAAMCGQRHFGENYVQEFLEKHEALQDLDLRWHFIGHLQTNKVKMIVGKVDYIHSIDSIKLAQEVSKRAVALNLTQKILLQVNLAGEASKGGFSRDEVKVSFAEIAALPGISVDGLMMIPPPVDNPEDSREQFRELRLLAEALGLSRRHDALQLSMGMTGDFAVAIEEGATLVRVGTAIFGARR